MPDYGGNRTYDLWNASATSTYEPAFHDVDIEGTEPKY